MKKLRRSRITLVLLNPNGIAPSQRLVPLGREALIPDEYFLEYKLEPIYSKGFAVPYRVRIP